MPGLRTSHQVRQMCGSGAAFRWRARPVPKRSLYPTSPQCRITITCSSVIRSGQRGLARSASEREWSRVDDGPNEMGCRGIAGTDGSSDVVAGDDISCDVRRRVVVVWDSLWRGLGPQRTSYGRGAPGPRRGRSGIAHRCIRHCRTTRFCLEFGHDESSGRVTYGECSAPASWSAVACWHCLTGRFRRQVRVCFHRRHRAEYRLRAWIRLVPVNGGSARA
jgi:hypothetical protein